MVCNLVLALSDGGDGLLLQFLEVVDSSIGHREDLAYVHCVIADDGFHLVDSGKEFDNSSDCSSSTCIIIRAA